MSDILDNELVRKYFWDEKYSEPSTMCAYLILRAMQEPIRKGELFLKLEKEWVEDIASFDDDEKLRWHPYFLRLPDKFQTSGKKECTERCKNVMHCDCHCHQPSPASERDRCCANGYFGQQHQCAKQPNETPWPRSEVTMNLKSQDKRKRIG